MSYTYLIIIIFIFTTPHLLPQVCSNTTTAAKSQEHTNGPATPPKQSSYFYQEPQGAGTYEFGYDLEDKSTENIQFKNETRFANGTVIGSYGFLRSDAVFTVVNYVADKNGYRTKKKRKDLLSSSIKSGQATTTTTEPTTPVVQVLNLTSGTLPPLLVDEIMDEFQIDLSPGASPGDILHPNISDIINGNIPSMTSKKNSQLGFDVVQNFIPSNFPIAPFQLPTEAPGKSLDD